MSETPGSSIVLLAALAVLLASGCAGEPPATPPGDVEAEVTEADALEAPIREALAGPRLRVLGTAQDGGLPHAACDCVRCAAARQDPARERLVASLALILPEAGQVYLIDATPDVRRQLDRLADVRDAPGDRVDRAPVDGVLLTHAHWGHYTGLGFFGFESVHTQKLPVFCSAAMARYLETNGPWSQLVRIGNVALRPFGETEPVRLTPEIWIEPLQVPHRDEYADTHGFILHGPRSRVLYVPDTEPWRHWERALPDLLIAERIDVALLDGSFFSADELPGREVSAIGHPLIRDSMDLLEPLVRDGKLRVWFTHLNHSNPALEPDGLARAEIEARGFGVLADGQELPL